MAIILILAGLILAASGYVQRKGLRSRTETEIAALSAALESYKADNGVYPRGQSVTLPPWDSCNGPSPYPIATTGTDGLNANPAKWPANGDPRQTIYQYASRYLYEQLSGDVDLNLSPDAGKKSYFDFKPSTLWLVPGCYGSSSSIGLSHILDPFGNSYGYSTAYQADLDKIPPVNPPEHGYNPTFDLWSTGGVISTTSPPDQSQWIKNW
jgi:type II secretory pathway pseudopilin PulG